jgi:leucyl aminopeptidase
MHYSITRENPALENADCLIVGIFRAKKLSNVAEQLDKASKGAIREILANGDLIEEPGQSLLLYAIPGVRSPRILLVYCGEEEKVQLLDFRKLIALLTQRIKTLNLDRVSYYLADLQVLGLDCSRNIHQTIEIMEDGLYTFDQLKTKKIDKAVYSPPKNLIFYLPESEHSSDIAKTIQQAIAINVGIKFTKDLANLPGNICTPRYMAEQATNLAKDTGLAITVLDKDAVQTEGMGALLAVARGSTEPLRFVVLEYKGGGNEQKPVVLVGKGVTFDAGGISLKPAASMEEMKFDMAGAASVLGAFKSITTLKLPINVIGIMPLTENLPSGSAVKPGDVVKSLSGQTIEIINTDAEGRLILADALTYSRRFDPDVVIDIATLTSAMIIALGSVATGLMSNYKALATELERAGDQSYDRVWSLPLWEDYQEQIESNVADVANVGINGGKSITAACFLARFTRQLHWAHLDVAGTAWKSGKDKTATGRPVSLLVQFLINRSNKKD